MDDDDDRWYADDAAHDSTEVSCIICGGRLASTQEIQNDVCDQCRFTSNGLVE